VLLINFLSDCFKLMIIDCTFQTHPAMDQFLRIYFRLFWQFWLAFPSVLVFLPLLFRAFCIEKLRTPADELWIDVNRVLFVSIWSHIVFQFVSFLCLQGVYYIRNFRRFNFWILTISLSWLDHVIKKLESFDGMSQ